MVDSSNENLILKLNENIQQLETHVIQIEFLCSKIGEPNDSLELRNQILDWQHKAKKIVSNAQENFKNLKNLPNTPETTAQREKVTNNLIRVIDNLKKNIQKSLDKEKEHSIDQLGNSSLVSNFLFQSNQDLIVSSNNLDEIKPVRDHSSQIFQIQSNIDFLNRVIRDISIMCQDNGEILDKNQIKTENSNSKNGAFTFDISEFDDPLIRKLKEKVAFFLAIFITLSIFSLILLAILV